MPLDPKALCGSTQILKLVMCQVNLIHSLTQSTSKLIKPNQNTLRPTVPHVAQLNLNESNLY